MRENLEAALKHVLQHEGGYVNHPKDPGGATNRGVTQRVYDAYRDRQGVARRSVRAITADEVADIYKRQYWDAIRGDDLPSGLDYAMFDYAVNSGPRRAAQDLQREVGADVDGVIGNMTLRDVGKSDVHDLIDRLCARRMRFLKGLKHWSTFGKGWTRRVTDVLEIAMAMATDPKADTSAVQIEEASIKAVDAPRENVAQSHTIQATVVDMAAKAGAGVAALSAIDDRVIQIAVIALVGVMLVASLVIFRERLKAWADGWR
jgi:lysozyme family protein